MKIESPMSAISSYRERTVFIRDLRVLRLVGLGSQRVHEEDEGQSK